MRIALALVLVAACTAQRRDPATADAAVDGEPWEYIAPVTDVLVTSTGALWSYGSEICSLEFGCIYGDTTVSRHERASGGIYVIDSSPAGAMSIAGDENSAYIVTGISHEERYVKRIDGGAMSIPRPWTRGPAIDATHVYWAEQPATYSGYSLRKASRTGDGSDATTIATIGSVIRLAVFEGYVWIDTGGSLYRVRTTGGQLEQTIADVTTMEVAPSGLIVGRAKLGAQPFAELGRFDASGAYNVIVDVGTARAPRFVVADDRDVYWSNENMIYRYPLAGGAIEEVTLQQLQQGYAFAITAEQVLFDFTPEGFKTIAR